MVDGGPATVHPHWRGIISLPAIVLARGVDEDHRCELAKTTGYRMSSKQRHRRRKTVTHSLLSISARHPPRGWCARWQMWHERRCGWRGSNSTKLYRTGMEPSQGDSHGALVRPAVTTQADSKKIGGGVGRAAHGP
jgi:hypothetical protein